MIDKAKIEELSQIVRDPSRNPLNQEHKNRLDRAIAEFEADGSKNPFLELQGWFEGLNDEDRILAWSWTVRFGTGKKGVACAAHEAFYKGVLRAFGAKGYEHES